jgi:hypothetical protein
MYSAKKVSAIVATTIAAAGCAYMPALNTERRVEVSDLKAVVECEVVAAARALGPSLFKIGAWDVKSTLDLSLVEDIAADGHLVWAIPISNSLTPSASIDYKKTSTAHAEFITLIPRAKKGPAGSCTPGPDPSGTALGLAAWIESTFVALGSHDNAGLSYTVTFELTLGAGSRFGFTFARVPVTGDIGASATRTGHNQLVVSIAPHIEAPPEKPIEVVIVGDERQAASEAAPAAKRARAGRGAPAAAPGRREDVMTNPLGNQMLRQQAPVRLVPGTTVPLR